MPPAVVDIQSTCTIKLIRLHYCQKADTVSKVHWLLCVLLILDLTTKPDSRSGKTLFNPPVATDMKWLQSTANLASFSTDSYLLGKEVTITLYGLQSAHLLKSKLCTLLDTTGVGCRKKIKAYYITKNLRIAFFKSIFN